MQADQLVVFSLDPEILATVANGFYGFNGSKFSVQISIAVDLADMKMQ